MSEFISFLKDIFMLKTEDTKHIGLTKLTQITSAPEPESITPDKKTKTKSAVKISDLMRRAS